MPKASLTALYLKKYLYLHCDSVFLLLILTLHIIKISFLWLYIHREQELHLTKDYLLDYVEK